MLFRSKIDRSLAEERAAAEAAPPAPEEPPKADDSTDEWGTGNTAVLEPPRPSETSAESVSFADIMITESAEAKEYKICYCATQCYEPSSYVEIPGRLKMDMSTFTWAVESETVYRKEAAGPTELNIAVQRPSFATHSNPKEWELKLVRDYFGCGVLADTEKFSCVPDAMPPKDTHDSSGPTVIWERSTPGTSGAENASAAVGG